ncbi:MAG: hypothetical protein WC547_06245 [Candidatus Omnitrophota bacterium]
MRSIVFVIAAVFCFQGIVLAEDLVNDQTSTVMPATSRKKKLKSSWKSVQEEVKAAENEAASDTTDTITAVTSSDGTTVREVSSDGNSITTRETLVNGQGSDSYTLNLKTGVITLGAANGASAVITKESAPEAYEIALNKMAGTISEVQARKVLSDSEAAFLNDIQKTLSGYKTGTIFEVTSGNGLVRVTVRNDGTTITTDDTAISAKTWPYHLNLATGTITYIPYPYSQDDTAKQVTLTRASNPEEYKNAIQNMIDDVDRALNNSGASALTESQIQFLNRTKAVLTSYRDGTAVPPARPGDTVTDPAVWQKYYKDYVGYVKSMTDVTARGAAWETLAQDMYTMSRSHPERITAGAIDSVMNELALELKEKYRNADYKLDVSAAQKYVVDAALNFVKSDAFQNMTDNEQSAVGHYFMALSLELSWRSEFNAANKDLYPKIAEFFKTMLENGSVDDKALAFRQLMHLFRVDVWGSKEGNREVAEQILKTALNIDGGIQGLVNAWMKGIGDSSLVDEARAHIADALSQVIWQHEWLNNASSTKISDAELETLSEKVTVFLKGVNDGSIEISPAYRNSLIHSTGCAVITLMNKDKYSSDAGKALGNTYINFTRESLLLDADNGGSVTLQTSAINLMTHVKATAEAKKFDTVAEKCKNVLLDKDFDAASYIAKARNEMKSTPNADHAAFVGQGLANIEKIHLAAKTEKIDAASIKATIADIKAWLADPNHLKDMRIMQWQRALYEALAALVKEISQDDSGVVLDSAMQDDIFAIFATVPGLKDSLVKELATQDAAGMATTLRANGFNELASRIEEALGIPDTGELTMPVIPATGSTDPNGNITITFTSGTLDKAKLSQFWAKVTIDGKTEYWDLGTGAISDDGKSVTLKFDPKYDGKIITMQFYGFDNSGKQTGNSNAIKVTVNSSMSSVVIPSVSSALTTDANRNIYALFSQTFDASQLSEFWAMVTIDGEVQFWDLGLEAITPDGAGVPLNIDSQFKGKIITMKFYGFDTAGKQTAFTNLISFTVL